MSDQMETDSSSSPSSENIQQPLEVRDPKTGRFVPGNQAHAKYVIERKKERAAPILQAITEELAPDEIRVLLRRGIAMAQEMDDGGKVLLEYIRFIAAYAIGKPIQRAITANMDKEAFLDFFRRRDDEQDDEAIEGEVSDVASGG